MSRWKYAPWWLTPPVFFLALYWHGLQAWFQQDDFAWLNQSLDIATGTSLWEALFAPRAQGTIRPWSERGFFLLLHHWFGLDPRPFHAVVFVTQCANLWLLQWMLLHVTASRVAALAGPLLWLCGMGLATPLSWLSAYNQVQCAFFVLAAFACLLRAIETRAWRWWAAQWGFFLLGFGALEINVVYPALAMAYVLLYAREHWWRVLPLWAVSAAYALLHAMIAAKPTEGPYVRYWDASMVTTFGRYWGNALAGGFVLPHWQLPPWSWEPAAWTLAAVLAAFTVWAWRRGSRLAAFGVLWFASTIGPVLPLRDHFSVYYLALPGLGLALIWADWVRFAWWSPKLIWRAAAVAILLLHLGFSLPVHRATTRWHYDRGRRVQALVEGLARVHELHTGKIVLLEGLTSELFWGAFIDQPARIIGIRHVYLLPGAEKDIEVHPELGDLPRMIASEGMVARGLAWDQAVVYRYEETHLRNTTRAYWKQMPKRWLERRPRMVDVGQPAFARDLGEGWFELEGTYRWMGERAEVYLSAPTNAEKFIMIAGYCPDSQLEKGPLGLKVSVAGVLVGDVVVTKENASFEYTFPLPELPATASLVVRLEVDRTVRMPGDTRELGVVFGQIGLVGR